MLESNACIKSKNNNKLFLKLTCSLFADTTTPTTRSRPSTRRPERRDPPSKLFNQSITTWFFEWLAPTTDPNRVEMDWKQNGAIDFKESWFFVPFLVMARVEYAIHNLLFVTCYKFVTIFNYFCYTLQLF